MRTLSFFLATLVTWAALLEGDAFAHDPSPPVYSETPPPDTLLRPYDQHDLDEATRRSRVVRNGLIGTSVGFAVGAIIGGIGVSQCSTSTLPNGNEDVNCNNAGNVLVPLGGAIAGLSAIGMITTGIMLGVRNKQKRDIEREIRRRYTARRLHFDEKTGGLVF